MSEVLKNNLNPKATYKLTKIKVKNEDSRFFSPGDEYTGSGATMYGQNLLVGDVMTSPVVSATQNGDNFLVETKNSVYSLELVK